MEQIKTGLPAEKAGPKDVFLHLLSIIALYVSVGGFIALIFQFINVFFPDPIADGYVYLEGYYSSIRWYIALLVVIFPVYVWTIWYLNREYKNMPEKIGIRIRKWLVYFTLFAAALLIIGDLVAVIYYFLQGELTFRFFIKVFTILIVAATVFVYYFYEVKRGKEIPKGIVALAGNKSFSYAVIILVFVAAISGVFVAGTPQTERQRKFDVQRVSDLQTIQSNIVNYWQKKNAKLPPDLSSLSDTISGIKPLKDPVTGNDYEYIVTGTNTFSLCATFSLQSVNQEQRATPMATKPYSAPGNYIMDNWEHDGGRFCFDRLIDKDLYPPLPPPKN